MKNIPLLLETAFDRDYDAFKARWFELLRFPSIGTDPAHARDCADCATWLKKELQSIGFVAQVIETGGCASSHTAASEDGRPPNRPVRPPLVFAERPSDKPDAPTVLFYGHYDVQPVDPLNEWETPPFEPTERNGRVYARGANDDKGQFFFPLQAIRTLIKEKIPLPRLKIVLEGEEESGSLGIAHVIKTRPDLFQADVLGVSDTAMAADGRPAIVAGLRGVSQLNVTVTGADHDLHSGQNGGIAPNAAMVLTRLMATLHHSDGSVAVDGFMDGFQEPTEEELHLIERMPFDAAEYFKETGAEPVGGERGLSPQVRVGFRPVLEINGIHSGYGGPGYKTIIPARAEAKLSSRICQGQDPMACLDTIERHLQRHCPKGVRMEIVKNAGSFGGFRIDIHHPDFQKALNILQTLDPRGAVIKWEGASIPILTVLSRATGCPPLMVGGGMEGDRIHAPNESYSRAQARHGYLFWGRFIASL